MLCKKCGKELKSNAFMCVNCGTLTEIGNIANPKPLRKKDYKGVVMGVAGLIFALIFQIVTFVISGIGLVQAVKELKNLKLKEQTLSAFPISPQEESPFPLPQEEKDKKWQYEKSFQLNLAALVLAGLLSIVIVMAYSIF